MIRLHPIELPDYSIAYLVALSRLAAASTSGLGAVAGNVSLLAALVAGLVVLHGLSAVTAWENQWVNDRNG